MTRPRWRRIIDIMTRRKCMGKSGLLTARLYHALLKELPTSKQ